MDIKNYISIPGYNEDYKINEYGLVISFKGKKCKQLKQRISGNSKYLKVTLYKNGIYKSIDVHKLMAITFLKHINCGMKLVVDHIDSNIYNNHISNIRVVTNRQNLTKNVRKHSSQYTGVSFDKQRNKWSAQIYYNGKNIRLGRFDSEYDAKCCYDNFKIINKIL